MKYSAEDRSHHKKGIEMGKTYVRVEQYVKFLQNKRTEKIFAHIKCI